VNNMMRQRLLGRLNGNGHSIAAEHHLQQSQRSDAVLVVDDYDDVRETLSFALRNVGFIVALPPMVSKP
jgi:hypoxanthine phosphoribosyltransferase